MRRTLCLLLLHFALCVQCYIFHPKYSSNQTPGDFNIETIDPLQSQDWSSLDEKKEYVRGLSENRVERHVDAIFTNTYRKFLGQISARRYLQNMMGKTLGQDTQKKADPEDSSVLGEEVITLLSDSGIPDWRAEEHRETRL
ncbi:hypothetical protein XELAEV_18003089mg [Xenopus laevis]|uniref:Glucagon / GIP / secretin / VIP family domain-containing protein n=1 Tax=Xenopus laevis TaxID=8355 RepID=B7ZRL5_XENLA|nr:Unknown (protein for MGC:196936) [Xenopus laevis]OCT57753.1 hypothetical protein XELAEV_18003089mg [Xenopus laevis]